LTSAEYAASHPDAASFATGLYQDVLGRPADPAGAAALAALLQSGVGRGAAATLVLHSPEALRDEVGRLYLDILGRPADPTGGQFAAAALGGGLSEDALARLLLTSPEFLNA
jgi:hypothetical protein